MLEKRIKSRPAGSIYRPTIFAFVGVVTNKPEVPFAESIILKHKAALVGDNTNKGESTL